MYHTCTDPTGQCRNDHLHPILPLHSTFNLCVTRLLTMHAYYLTIPSIQAGKSKYMTVALEASSPLFYIIHFSFLGYRITYTTHLYRMSPILFYNAPGCTIVPLELYNCDGTLHFEGSQVTQGSFKLSFAKVSGSERFNSIHVWAYI